MSQRRPCWSSEMGPLFAMPRVAAGGRGAMVQKLQGDPELSVRLVGSRRKRGKSGPMTDDEANGTAYDHHRSDATQGLVNGVANSSN